MYGHIVKIQTNEETYIIIYFPVGSWSLFQACDDTKTYAEMLEEERDGVNDFIKKNNIEVITVEEFEKDTITECEDGYPVQYPGKNQYVAFSNGIYMQVVQRYGTPRAASEPYPNLEAALPFETGNLILTRFKEVDILTGEPTSVSNVDNQYYPPMNNYPTGFRYTIDGTSIYGQFIQEPGLDSEYYWDVTIGGQYGTSVPAGWLMALQYIKDGAHVRLIVPSKSGHSYAQQKVYPYFYDIYRFSIY